MIIDFRNTFFICEGELNESRTCKSDLQVQIKGNKNVKRNVKIQNLERQNQIEKEIDSKLLDILKENKQYG